MDMNAPQAMTFGERAHQDGADAAALARRSSQFSSAASDAALWTREAGSPASRGRRLRLFAKSAELFASLPSSEGGVLCWAAVGRAQGGLEALGQLDAAMSESAGELGSPVDLMARAGMLREAMRHCALELAGSGDPKRTAYASLDWARTQIGAHAGLESVAAAYGLAGLVDGFSQACENFGAGQDKAVRVAALAHALFEDVPWDIGLAKFTFEGLDSAKANCAARICPWSAIEP
jgi:hypothetical protein